MVTTPEGGSAIASVPMCGQVIAYERGPWLDKEKCMRKRNVWTALAAAAMVMQLVVTAGPAAAQTPPEVEFSFTPTSGPAGTKIDITGTGCPHSATAPLDGVAFLTRQGSDTPIEATQVEFVPNQHATEAVTAAPARAASHGPAPARRTPIIGLASSGRRRWRNTSWTSTG